MSFTDDLRRIAQSNRANADALVRKIVLDIGTAVVMKSPVGDPKYWVRPPPPGYVGGRFRGNWQIGIGAANTFTDMTIDKTGQLSIGRIRDGIPQDAAGNVYYITNSLPYANRLEEGHSKRQAPNGMVRITRLEFEPIVGEAVSVIYNG